MVDMKNIRSCSKCGKTLKDSEICDCNKEKTCGNPYSNLWVELKFTLEGSEYCKNIREEDTSPAFHFAVCDKCVEKKCKFISICLELYEMNKREHEEEIDTEIERNISSN